jgi:hypothetical protein
MDRYVALELKAQEENILADFASPVFDDHSGLDRRQGEAFAMTLYLPNLAIVVSKIAPGASSTTVPSALIVRAATSAILLPPKNGNSTFFWVSQPRSVKILMRT